MGRTVLACFNPEWPNLILAVARFDPGALRTLAVIFIGTQSIKMVPRINHSLGAATMLRHRTPVLNAFSLSDDECVQRLALLIEHRDNKNLDEIAALIARL